MNDPQEAARALLEDFLEPGRRSFATHELAALGESAVPAVAALLDGTATNRGGIPLRSFGEAVRCAIVTARHLGSLAAPLEPLLRAELRSEWDFLRWEAASALGALGSVSDETAGELAALLDDISDSGLEAAIALKQLGLDGHAVVLAAVDASPRARSNMARARARGGT